MSKNKIKGKVDVDIAISINLTLTVGEAKALGAIVAYGSKPFLGFFYEKLGTLQLSPHEEDMILLFKTISTDLNPQIKRIDTATKAINKALKELNNEQN